MSDVADGSRDSIDQSVLTSLRELQDEGEPDIVAEVGGMFLKYSPQKIAAMKKAIEAGDAKALEVAAHGLKSSSSYIGAIKLSAISKELESMGRKCELEGALERAILVQTEFERVKAALEVEIKKVGNIGLKKI
jgi:HPt (histidine-containing phosphotransfer) domain-containing protein